MTTIVRVRTSPGGTDAYGDPVPGTVTRTTIDGAFVAPRMTEELDAANRVAGVVVGLTLFAHFTTDLVHTDQVEVDGTLYEVEGEVGRWLNPFTGWEAGLTVALTRVAG